MALKGSFTGSTNNENIQPTIEWSAVQNVAGNYSDVTVTLKYSRLNTGYTTSGTWSGSISINGSSESGSKYLEISYQSGTVAMTAKRRVSQNADGSKSVTISASGGIPGTSFSSTSISQTVTLDTIPRASGLSCPTVTLGQTVTLTVDRKSASFWHAISYQLGKESGTICSYFVNAEMRTKTSIPWTPAVSLSEEIPNAAKGTGTLTIITYDGNVEIGRKSVPFTAVVPSDIVPTAELSVTVNRGGAPWDGVAVKGYGTITYAITAQGAQGSTIKSYRFSCGGQEGSSASGTTGALSQAGIFTPTATVTDSRGRTAAVTAAEITVEDYSYPSLQTANAYRCDSEGTANRRGSYVKVEMAANCASVGGRNQATTRYRSRQVGGSWSGYTTATEAVVPGFLATHTYEVELSAVDTVGNVRAVVVTIPTAEAAFHLKRGGKGAAFGKYAEEDNALDLAWDVIFEGKQQQGEHAIRFANSEDAEHPHNATLYGGNPNSDTAIGLWDSKNSRRILIYEDADNALYLGNTGTVNYVQGAITYDGNAKMQILPGYTQSQLNPGITATETFMKNLLIKICTDFPLRTNTVYVGAVRPNSWTFVELFIYDTSKKNSAGLPQYSGGYVYFAAQNARMAFGTDGYTWYYKTL